MELIRRGVQYRKETRIGSKRIFNGEMIRMKNGKKVFHILDLERSKQRRISNSEYGAETFA